MLISWCAGGIELMNLVEASKYEAKWKKDRISKKDNVLSANIDGENLNYNLVQ
jgi:hypothetical protein